MVQKITEFHSFIKAIDLEKDLKNPWSDISTRLINTGLSINLNDFRISLKNKIERVSNFEKHLDNMENNHSEVTAFLRSMLCTAIVAGSVFAIAALTVSAVTASGIAPVLLFLGLSASVAVVAYISTVVLASYSFLSIKNIRGELCVEELFCFASLGPVTGIIGPLIEMFCLKRGIEDNYKIAIKNLEEDVSTLKDFLDKHYDEIIDFTEKSIDRFEVILSNYSKLKMKAEVEKIEKEIVNYELFLNDLKYLKEKINE